MLSRAIAQGMKNSLPKPVVVVNRDGANGMIATAETVRTKPDGYTLTQGASGLFLTQPFVQKKLEYKQDDFDFLIGLTNEPILMTVNAGSPYQTLEEMIKGFKEKNQVVRYSNSGMGGFPQLCPAYLFNLAGVKSQPIPFKGGAPALTAILGGHVDACASHPGEAYPHIKAGKLRPLAVSSLKRFPALPDVPTLKEKGYDIDMGVKKFIFAPKGSAGRCQEDPRRGAPESIGGPGIQEDHGGYSPDAGAHDRERSGGLLQRPGSHHEKTDRRDFQGPACPGEMIFFPVAGFRPETKIPPPVTGEGRVGVIKVWTIKNIISQSPSTLSPSRAGEGIFGLKLAFKGPAENQSPSLALPSRAVGWVGVKSNAQAFWEGRFHFVRENPKHHRPGLHRGGQRWFTCTNPSTSLSVRPTCLTWDSSRS